MSLTTSLMLLRRNARRDRAGKPICEICGTPTPRSVDDLAAEAEVRQVLLKVEGTWITFRVCSDTCMAHMVNRLDLDRDTA